MPKADDQIVHIRCGDDMRPAFEAAGLEGSYLRCADPLCEGPTPAGASKAKWRDLRAGFAAERYAADPDYALKFVTDLEAGLEATRRADEIVLWFEHDLFDQIILIRLLDWFGRRKGMREKLRLICIDGYPGVERFFGLGQLGPAALLDLHERRPPVTAAQTGLARRAWSAFKAADPRGRAALLTEDTTDLPFLGAALLRHLEDFPGVHDGLARTERQAMLAAQEGAVSAVTVFRSNQAMEEAPWCGDAMFWGWLRSLAEARLPTLAISGPEAWYRDAESAQATSVSLTRAGHAILRGIADWAKAGVIDRWMGGTHLQGEKINWRWDEANRQLVAKE